MDIACNKCQKHIAAIEEEGSSFFICEDCEDNIGYTGIVRMEQAMEQAVQGSEAPTECAFCHGSPYEGLLILLNGLSYCLQCLKDNEPDSYTHLYNWRSV